MIHLVNIFMIIGAYLLGSIPTSVWVSKHFHGIDIRQYGSGNAGATNTIRVLGWKAGLPVLAFDVFKGWLAVNLIHFDDFFIPQTTAFVSFQLILGLAALIGHIFPVYVGFKGGKGVATLFGMVLAIHPYPTLICVGIFLLSLLITKYVSLSSMIAGFAFPFMVVFVFHTTTPTLVTFSLAVAILLLFTHQKNIERLLKREESKATFLTSRKHQLPIKRQDYR
jgi:acyl phosphate:glycerol-3-phosphate acyltransferase